MIGNTTRLGLALILLCGCLTLNGCGSSTVSGPANPVDPGEDAAAGVSSDISRSQDQKK